MERRKIVGRCGIALALLLVSLALTHRGVYAGDTIENFFQYRAFLEENSLYLDSYEDRLFRIWRGAHGHAYSVYGVGYPLLAAAFGKTLAALGIESTIITFKLPNTLLFFLSAYLLCRLLAAWGASRVNIVLVFVALVFSTQASYYCASWSSNSFVASLLIIAFYYYVRATGGVEPRPEVANRQLVFAGAAIGYAGLSRSFPFLIAPGFALALLYELVRVRGHAPLSKPVLKAQLALGIPVVLAFAAQIGIDFLKTGILQSTYASGGFTTPFYVGFLGNLLWPGKSVLFFAPITVLSAFALHCLYRKSRVLFFLSLYIVAVYVIGYSKWAVWWSGPSIANRYWLPALPFLIFPLALTKNRWIMAAAVLLIAFGSYTQVRMHDRNPRPIYRAIYRDFPYSEDRDKVQKIIHSDLLRVLKVTFIEGAFFEHIGGQRRSRSLRTPLERQEYNVLDPGNPQVFDQEPIELGD
jgi:hypothetical protein